MLPTGPDKSEGNKIVGNRISVCENIGIGTASNGTLISDNTVSDIGMRARTTYTLLGQRVTTASGGHGYSLGDVLTFVGGQYIKPAQVQVTAVGAGGTVNSITLPSRTTAYYLGVYTTPPPNPVSVKGGNGTGATFSTPWNARALKYAGIAVVDAANVAITNNRSGNSPGTLATIRHCLTSTVYRSIARYDQRQHTFRECGRLGVSSDEAWRARTVTLMA